MSVELWYVYDTSSAVGLTYMNFNNICQCSFKNLIEAPVASFTTLAIF